MSQRFKNHSKPRFLAPHAEAHPAPKETRSGRPEPRSTKSDNRDYLYGILPVEQALLARKRRLETLYLKTEAPSSPRLQRLEQLALEMSVPVQTVPKEKLDFFCPNGPHQGVVLQCSPLGFSALEALDGTDPKSSLIVALDQVEDPHNLGAIIRSCGFFQAAGVVLPMHHSARLTPTVSKASAGVVESFPVVAVTNLSRFLQEQKARGYWIVGLDEDGDQELSSLSLDLPLVMVAGNEGEGLRQGVKKACDLILKIPGNSQVASLNVSNAVAVALYQCHTRFLASMPPAKRV